LPQIAYTHSRPQSRFESIVRQHVLRWVVVQFRRVRLLPLNF
jgi:hypothetical protein